jgi:monoamine oxidase
VQGDEWDVIVVGAGVAGLAALADLRRGGLKAICLEARDRIGGRIMTVRDHLSPVPLELGAEFVHGRPPETWRLIRSGTLAAYEIAERAVRIRNDQPDTHVPSWELVGEIMGEMDQAAEGSEDISFQTFLRTSKHPDEAKQLATSYVEGFNAARKEIVGIQSLAKDARAANLIGGDQSYRILDGYDRIPDLLARTGMKSAERVHLNSRVREVHWEKGRVTVHTERIFGGETVLYHETITAKAIVLTLPLGVLQADPDEIGAVRFVPDIPDHLAAARQLAFGHVMRVVMRFARAFWEENEELADVGFLLSDETHFPTWWTTLPVRAPVLVGWSAGPHAEALLAASAQTVISVALEDLARVTQTNVSRLRSLLEQIHFHPWHRDPYARGAYSYVPAGALPAREKLAAPIADTLYFAGEATELDGHSATVHGAIASGRHAAKLILDNRR